MLESGAGDSYKIFETRQFLRDLARLGPAAQKRLEAKLRQHVYPILRDNPHLRLNRAALASTLADPAVLAVVLQRLTAQLGEAILLPPLCYRDCFAALLVRRAHDGRCSLYVMPPD